MIINNNKVGICGNSSSSSSENQGRQIFDSPLLGHVYSTVEDFLCDNPYQQEPFIQLVTSYQPAFDKHIHSNGTLTSFNIKEIEQSILYRVVFLK